MRICIYAAASDRIDRKYVSAIEDLGRALALQNHSLVYGGGGTGLMGAAARGFRKVGGEVVGVIPTFIHDLEPSFADCTEVIETETMADRKEIMEEKADVFLIVPGGVGTFDEFFQCLTLKDLNRHNKKIILYNFDDYFTKMIEYLDDCVGKGFIRSDVREYYTIANNPIDVLNQL